MPKPVIEIRGMHKDYGAGDTRIPVLKGVDIVIEPGEVVALMGPSGSGKSTLLNILGCLDRPTSGSYMLGGRNVSTLSRSEQAWVRLHFLGFIFQSFHLLSDSTVLENVAMPLFYAGVGREEREARAHTLIERVGLKERVLHRPSELSGGQRQRVAIARSLVNSPKVLLADE
ncbi:MAG: macB 2, partial [Myxococcaceae bacterium]|nr:macB 2 [Myxococcaceae bacterium]